MKIFTILMASTIFILMTIFLATSGGGLSEKLVPSGAGTYSQWPGVSYTGVIDNNNNTAVAVNVVAGNQTYAFTNHGGSATDIINNVTAYAICKRSGSGPTFNFMINSSTVNNLFYLSTAQAATTSFVVYQTNWSRDPADNSAWNSTKINNMQIGTRLAATSSSRYMNCSEYWAIVDYTASTCTYSGSGNWNIDCSNNCIFSSTQTIANNNNITITGTGTLTFNNGGKWSFTGTNQYITIASGCTLNINTGGGWNY